jgi:hypothetical protein
MVSTVAFPKHIIRGSWNKRSMRKTIIFFILAYSTACNTADSNKVTKYNLTTAKDAFDYPDLKNKNDTDIYIYQLKDVLTKQDSLLYVEYGSAFLKQFGEQNFSLRPLALETFRFSYDPFGQKPINITFDRNKMTVKIGVSGSLYPIDTSAKFKYKTQTILLSIIEYNSLIDSLKASHFDALPWELEHPEMVTDGGGYTFEANTKDKFKYFVCYGLPIKSLPMTKFCKHLLKVAKVDKEINL